MSRSEGRVTAAEVRRIARLARLQVGEEELERFVQHFQQILDYFGELRTVSTEGVEPTYQATGSHPPTPFRKDEVRPSLALGEILQGAPEAARGHFRVPRVIEEE